MSERRPPKRWRRLDLSRNDQALFEKMGEARSIEELRRIEPQALEIAKRYYRGLKGAYPSEMVIHRRIGKLNYEKKCIQASVVAAFRRRGVKVAPGMAAGEMREDGMSILSGTPWSSIFKGRGALSIFPSPQSGPFLIESSRSYKFSTSLPPIFRGWGDIGPGRGLSRRGYWRIRVFLRAKSVLKHTRNLTNPIKLVEFGYKMGQKNQQRSALFDCLDILDVIFL